MVQSPGGGTTPLTTGLLATAGGLLAVVALLGVWRAGTVIGMLVAAMFFAIGLERPVLALTRRGLRRRVAVVAVAATSVVLVVGGLLFILPPLVRQIDNFFAAVPELASSLAGQPAIADLAAATDLETRLTEAVTPSNLAPLVTGLVSAVGSVAGVIATAVSTAILSLFVLGGLHRVRAGAYRLVPASRRDRFQALAQAMQDKVGQYLVGSILVAAIAGTTALLWTTATGIPYPAVMALIVAAFDLVPQIGATVGSTIVTLAALTSSVGLAVATIVFFCCYQGVENWVVYPRVMSRAVEISALAALVSAMVGWALFGVLGVVLAVPVYASLQLLLREVFLTRQASR